jgi:hypothetical protein
MQKTRITDQSPVIRLPDSHHRKAKVWATLQGLTLRDAMCVLIDQAWAATDVAEAIKSDDAGRAEP